MKVYHINATKDKTHVLISKDPEKATDKIQHPLLTKNFPKTGLKRDFFNLIKDIYEKNQS